jgi:hypothetical protein
VVDSLATTGVGIIDLRLDDYLTSLEQIDEFRTWVDAVDRELTAYPERCPSGRLNPLLERFRMTLNKDYEARPIRTTLEELKCLVQ